MTSFRCHDRGSIHTTKNGTTQESSRYRTIDIIGPDWYQIGDTNLDHFNLFQILDTSLAPISLQASLSFGKTFSLCILLDSTSKTECMYLS